MTVAVRGDELKALLDELAREHGVPGAALAVLDGDEVTEAATGVVNRNTGVEVTTDTLFQIGSISKVYTTTLVMQLIDEGKVGLDAPVREYLSDLKFADSKASEEITVRQLLAHTSGVDGDLFEDAGRGDDCVEKYVAACSVLPQIAAPGQMVSYCNAGFVVAGRLVEAVTGKTWDEALRDMLVKPLGLGKTVTLPEEALLHRTAVGHIVNPEDPSAGLIVAPAWMLPRSMGPAGLIVSTAAEVLAFARLHLDDGRGPDGTQVLSPQSVKLMKKEQAEIPDQTLGRARGLGWIIFDWSGTKVIGHDGGTIGQTAFLRIAPDRRFAVCLLTNGATSPSLHREVFEHLFREKEIEVPDPPREAEGLDFDPEPFAGTYERFNVKTRVEVAEGGLVASIDMEGLLARIFPEVRRVPLRPVTPTTALVRLPLHDMDVAVVFFDFDDEGRPRYMHTGGRAARKVS